MSSLILIRHGETAWNSERRIQGHSDNALNARGRAQALQAAAVLAGQPVERMLSSPLRRAHDTAGIIATHLSVARCVVDAALLERNYGAAEGLTVAEVEQRWPTGEYPGAESVARLRSRAAGTIERLALSHSGAIAVSHGAFIRAGVEALTGTAVPRILNGQAISVHRHSTGWRWELVSHHLA